MSTITRHMTRHSFATVVRAAMRAGTLTSYERDHWMGRDATLADGSLHLYEPGYQCNEREKGDDDGVEYADPRDAREERWS